MIDVQEPVRAQTLEDFLTRVPPRVRRGANDLAHMPGVEGVALLENADRVGPYRGETTVTPFGRECAFKDLEAVGDHTRLGSRVAGDHARQVVTVYFEQPTASHDHGQVPSETTPPAGPADTTGPTEAGAAG